MRKKILNFLETTLAIQCPLKKGTLIPIKENCRTFTEFTPEEGQNYVQFPGDGKAYQSKQKCPYSGNMIGIDFNNCINGIYCSYKSEKE